jgi:hypothetical protein
MPYALTGPTKAKTSSDPSCLIVDSAHYDHASPFSMIASNTRMQSKWMTNHALW